MRPFLTLPAVILTLATLASCSGGGKTASGPVPRYTIQQFMNTQRIGGGAFSPDETQLLYYSNATGVINAYTQPVTGGTPTQVTFSTTESIFPIGYLSDGKRILYAADQGGDENDHLYVFTLADTTAVDVTPVPKTAAQFMAWNTDKSGFFFSWNKRTPKYFDVYYCPVASLKPELVFENQEGLTPAVVHPSGQFMAFTLSSTTDDSDVWLYEVKAKKLSNLTEHKGSVSNSPADFSPDGKTLYYTSDQGSEFSYVMGYDIATGQKQEVYRDSWDVSAFYFNESGTHRVVAINADARTQVKVFSVADGKQVPTPAVTSGDMVGVTIAPSGKVIKFAVNGSASPSDIFTAELGKTEATRLTTALSADIKPEHLTEGHAVRYKSFDGMEIPALLYTPKGLAAAEKVPVILWIHGGPGGQTRLNYSGQMQYLLNHGYGILAVNNRGSSGYGKTFYAADNLKHGEADLQDCVEAKKYLATLPWADTSKTIIMGGSYGGYMVLAGLAFRPGEFVAGVDIFGVSNWLRTLTSIPPYWESFRKALYTELGDPFTADSVRLRAISPLFHAQNIRRPLIVLQGVNDPRVIQPESDDIVARVKANGVPVEYIVFPDEGHGFLKRANEERAYEAVLQFLDAHVKGTKPVAEQPAS